MMQQPLQLGPPQQYQQPPPQFGQTQQPPPNWQASAGHPSTMSYNEYPSPGQHHLTGKQLWTRIAIAFAGGMATGGFIMFKLFPVFIRILQAAAEGT